MGLIALVPQEGIRFLPTQPYPHRSQRRPGAASPGHGQGDRGRDPGHRRFRRPDGESVDKLRRQGRDHPGIPTHGGPGRPRGLSREESVPAGTLINPSCRTPTSSSAAPTSSASPIFSFGNPPTRSCISAPSSGRTGTGSDLREALADYGRRSRRFGGAS